MADGELGSGSVLIVEDDAATAELERRALARAGVEVHAVGTVRGALDLLSRRSFSAILLDYQLPDGDSWLVVDAARSRSPRIPVIVVTAMGNERVAAEAIHRGVVEYVRKADTFWDQLPGVVGRVARLAHAEERLRRSDELFKLIADNASDMITTMEVSGTIKYISPSCQRILGFTPAELIGTPWLASVHPDDLAQVSAAFAQVDTLDQARVVHRRLRRDLEPVWVESTINVSRDPETGGVAEVISITRDVTERKAAEDALRLEQERLAEALAEREILLQEIHHRVKNNLQVISSLISMQVRRLAPGASRDHLEACQTRVQAIALIHEKLYQTQDYASVPFSVYAQSLVKSIVATTGATVGQIALELDIDEVSLAMDKAIPCALILNEIVTNALKHAFPDGRSGSIALTLKHGPDHQLHLVVRDDGIGAGDRATSGTPGSMGTMLVKTLARQLRGTLSIDGTQGTTVRLSFPVGG